MHELHLVKDVINDLLAAAEKNNAAKITKVYISLGMLTEITPYILKAHFKELTKNTPADGAVLNIAKSSKRELRLISFDCD